MGRPVAGVLAVVVFVAVVVAAFLQVAAAVGVKVDGWTEVRPSWPIEEQNYFIATEKGHHFIEVKVPAQLEADLQVKLRYYFSYSKVRPVIQMTPCNDNIYLVNETPGNATNNQPQGRQWTVDERRVSKANCARRPELAYNVLLHDPGDVFAWSLMEVRSEPQAQPQPIEVPKPGDSPGSSSSSATAQLVDPSSSTGPAASGTTQNDQAGSKPTTKDTEDKPAKEPVKTPAESQTTDEEVPPIKPIKPMKPLSDLEGELTDQKSEEQTNEVAPSGEEPKKTTTTDEEGIEMTTKKRLEAIPEEEEDNKDYDDDVNRNPDTKPLVIDEKQLAVIEEPQKKKKNVVRKTSRARNNPNSLRANLDDAERPMMRFRRDIDTTSVGADASASSSGGSNRQLNLVCRPSLCDRSIFKMNRFTAILARLPAVPDAVEFGKKGAHKYLFNNKMKPLIFRVENNQEAADGETFEEVDTCIRLRMFMEAQTEMEMWLAGGGDTSPADNLPSKGANNGPRLLETIKRNASDSTAGKWDTFSRCISDYMPAYRRRTPAGKQTSGKETDTKEVTSSDSDSSSGTGPTASTAAADQLRFIFVQKMPKNYQPDKRVAVLVDPKNVTELRRLHSTRPYIPDIGHLQQTTASGGSATTSFSDFWILDRDGLKKPVVGFIRQSKSDQPSTSNVRPEDIEQVLQISNIDSAQESFDITSRWMKIKDAELMDDPVLFVYKADKADWIRQIDLQFQRAGDPFDTWVTQTAYVADQSSPSSPSSSPSSPKGDKSDKNNNNDLQGKISLPIKMTGLDSDEFRIRIKHLMKTSYSSNGRQQRPHDAKLIVRSMAFADACASSATNLCQNGATCSPTGAATYECACRQGFSGRYCDNVRPCEVLYGDHQRTGHEMCTALGATCVEGIPVMRCQWANDQYYQCKALFQTAGGSSGGGGDGVNLPGNSEGMKIPIYEPNNNNNSTNLDNMTPFEQAQHLKDVVNQQAKLIIILGVFIVALLLFAVVLIGNLVMRVRKSGRRLARSKNENLELARRAATTGGGGAAGAGTSSTFHEPTGGAVNGSSLFPAVGHHQRGPRSPVTSYNNSAFNVE